MDAIAATHKVVPRWKYRYMKITEAAAWFFAARLAANHGEWDYVALGLGGFLVFEVIHQVLRRRSAAAKMKAAIEAEKEES